MSITKLNNRSLTAVTALPSGVGGKVLQVVSTTKTDSFVSSTITENTGVDITGLSVNITPSSTSSKILIIYNANGSFSYSTRQGSCGIRLLRNSTFISAPTSSGTRPTITAGNNFQGAADDNCETNVAGSFLDSPSTTSSTTYKLQAYNMASTGRAVAINRTYGDNDETNVRTRSTSTITVYEIAG